MEKYFDIQNTPYCNYSISLHPQVANGAPEESRILRMPEPSFANGADEVSYDLTIKKLNVYSPLTTYIRELPRDMNNLIYSFLSEPDNFVVKISIRLPPKYPFEQSQWQVKSWVGRRTIPDPVCKVDLWSPSMTLDLEVIYFVSQLLFPHNNA
jgi:hypothetical protein